MINKRHGFTIIELMIAIAIVGVLAAIAISAYQDYIKRAKVSEGIVLASQAKIAVTEYYQNKGAFPTSNDEAGLAKGDTITGNSVDSVSIINDGTVEVTYKLAKNGGISTTTPLTLDFTPLVESSGVLLWSINSSGTTGVPSKWCPSSAQCDGSGS